MTNNVSKIKLIKLWDVLRQESDEERPLATNEILDKLKALGVECDRRTLYSDIATLNSFGYEVLCKKGQHSNQYYVVDRSFDIPELHILLDAVQAAGFITNKKTAELTDKIAALAGSYQAELLKRNVVQFNTVKHSNENIYYNVSNVTDAIIAEKKLSFRYFDYGERRERVFRKSGETYLVNPIATVFSNDSYYLVCYHDNHDDVANYRIDRMTDVVVSADPINKKKQPKGFEIAKHRKQAFSMFMGETEKVRFIARRDMINTIFDKFGESTKIINRSEDEIEFDAEIAISNMFFGWCCSFGDRLKIAAPENVREQFNGYLQSLIDGNR